MTLGAPHDHTVLVYDEDRELVEEVAAWLGAGLDQGGAAVGLVSAEHLRGLRALLADRALDVRALESDGRLTLRDADAILPDVLEHGVPSRARFERTVTRLLDRASVGGRPVRIFGELVDILYRRGDAVAADRLEKLWNGLAAHRRFALLCGYGCADVFARDVQAELLPQVLRTHARVHAVGDPERMRTAVDSALVESLGVAEAAMIYERVFARHRGRMPAPQLALMWVSRHMPRAAERVLAAAREHYAPSLERVAG
jgi:hypothetical protein